MKDLVVSSQSTKWSVSTEISQAGDGQDTADFRFDRSNSLRS
jgi:hypothetical protein